MVLNKEQVKQIEVDYSCSNVKVENNYITAIEDNPSNLENTGERINLIDPSTFFDKYGEVEGEPLTCKEFVKKQITKQQKFHFFGVFTAHIKPGSYKKATIRTTINRLGYSCRTDHMGDIFAVIRAGGKK